MGRTLYMECQSGISGDMTVAALLDLGADQTVLQNALDSIPVKGFQAKVSRIKKQGLDCMDFSVVLEKEYENHDHDMEYLHGHEKHHLHGKSHLHEESYIHEKKHTHGEEREHIHEGHGEQHIHRESRIHEEHHTQRGHHVHRRLRDIFEILRETRMTEGAGKIAERIFRILAEAEAKAHGETVEEVHFHEIGAVDSIVDIVAAAVCFDNLEISEVIVPEVCEGRGTVRCAHGILPVPVPAAANIMEKYSIPVRFSEVRGELVTPTGAAILAAMMTSDHMDGAFQIERIGCGAGKRTYECPGILRLMLVKPDAGMREAREPETGDLIYKLETNIDDCTGEALGYTLERLFLAGAKDVHFIPVYMKKNRPGVQLNVICEKKDIEHMEQIIFSETTTIGIRRIPCERTVLPRRLMKVRTRFGEVQVKVCGEGEKKKYYPEYESVAEICREQGVSYKEVYAEVLCAVEKTERG